MASTKETRNYEVSDSEMLAGAREFHAEYSNYSEGFINLDALTFTPTFNDEFKGRITLAEDLPSDDVLIDRQVQETADVDETVDHCLNAIRFARYFISKAAKKQGRPQILNEFGYNDLEAARGSGKKMILFMKDFLVGLNAYSADLIAENFTSEKMTEIKDLAESLEQECAEQTEAKNNRHRTTVSRVRLMNSVWNDMVLFADAVEFAHPDDAVARAIFTLPRKSPSSPAGE